MFKTWLQIQGLFYINNFSKYADMKSLLRAWPIELLKQPLPSHYNQVHSF